MQQIAEDTGGKAFMDTNGVKEAVGQAIANGARYYTLGYIPQITKNDGSYRRIKVNVEGSYQTSYRRGYYAYDSLKVGANSSATSNPMRAAIQYGAPPLSEIPFKVRVIAAGDPAVKGNAISPEPAGVDPETSVSRERRCAISSTMPSTHIGLLTQQRPTEFATRASNSPLRHTTGTASS
jgi:hypothetical protein